MFTVKCFDLSDGWRRTPQECYLGINDGITLSSFLLLLINGIIHRVFLPSFMDEIEKNVFNKQTKFCKFMFQVVFLANIVLGFKHFTLVIITNLIKHIQFCMTQHLYSTFFRCTIELWQFFIKRGEISETLQVVLLINTSYLQV